MTNLPYLSETEIRSFTDNNELEKAQALNNERYTAEQEALKQQFVENATKLSSDAKQKRSIDDQTEFAQYLRMAGDPISALDVFLYNRADYRTAMNVLLEERGFKPISYLGFSAKHGSDSFRKYVSDEKMAGNTRASIYTSDAPGVGNTIDTTVSQSIMYRAENQGKILPLIDKINIPFGNYDEPYYNKYSTAVYLAENGTIPTIEGDLNDATNGIKKNSWTPRDFANGLKQSFKTLNNLSPSVLTQILSYLSDSLTRGMEYNAISGPGTGVTDSGVITVATSATVGSDIYETFQNALGAVESVNVATSNITAVMNAKTWRAFKKLKVINQAYRDAIGMTNIEEIPVVVVPETIIATSTGSATVVVGDFKHYLAVTNGSLQKYQLDTPENLQRFTAFHILRDAGARFADSFAKFTVSGL